jgi:hypothetical protein
MTMKSGTALAALLCSAAVLCSVAAMGGTVAGPRWEISGNFSEACTCSVPCSCNFGEGPSPHHYCWSMIGIEIEHGHYGAVKLDGLNMAGAHGKKTAVWYIDSKATPEQVAALKAMLNQMFHPKHLQVYFETAEVTQEVGAKSHRVTISGHGGFEADYIIGRDGKTPIVVDNMDEYNLDHDIKAKTKELSYRDRHGNKFTVRGTNSNEGHFDWTDETQQFF